MLSAYENESGFRPENESDIMLRMRVLAGEVYREHAYAEYILRQMFPATATGEYLDAHAQQRGLSRKNATYAAGRVTFTAVDQEHEEIRIPAGTEVCTAEDQLRFTTDRDAVISAEGSTVHVNVTAVQPGSAYNVSPGSVSIIVTPVLGIAAVSNGSSFSGGTDTESDDLLRERVIDSYRNVINGANAAYYRSIAMSVDGVYSASAVGCGRGVGTVDVYACGRGSTLSAAKLNEIRSLMEEKREVNADVKVFSPTAVNINLYIILTVEDGYDFNTVAGEVQTVVTDYINGLGIGHNLLLCDVGDVIYHTEGVEDYQFVESYGSSRMVPLTHYAKANNILVRAY